MIDEMVKVERRRVVVKIGSSLLTNNGTGINKELINSVCDQAHALICKGHQIALVSSGAVASDVNLHRSKGLRAAVGQPKLFERYRYCFYGYGFEAAQFLVNDLLLRHGHDNNYTRDLIIEAINEGVIPIINGHDTANDFELKMLERCADNDVLARLIAVLIDATDLIIAIDEDGLLDGDKNIIHEASLSKKDYYLGLANGGNAVGHGSDGMRTKLQNLFNAITHDIRAIMAPGKAKNFILRAFEGEKNFGTLFTK